MIDPPAVSAGSADGPLTEVAIVFETAGGWEMQRFDDRLIDEPGAVFDAATGRRIVNPPPAPGA